MSSLLPACAASAPALIDAERGVTLTHGELRQRVDRAAASLGRAVPGLALLLAGNDVETIVAYLACIASRRPVVLVDPAWAGARLQRLVETYRPALIVARADAAVAPTGGSPWPIEACEGLAAWPCAGESAPANDALALLLTTSGSTGNPKLVRLTLRNVVSNASSIASYLELEESERAVLNLPIHYSYGLSVLNSHLVAGASVVLTGESVLRPEFWRAFDGNGCTSLAGVPHVWETLHRLRFDPARHPTLRTMTQAGGALRPELVRAFHDKAAASGRRFFVMYGQTEASPRIAYVPFDRLGEKIGSIGVAIPEGSLSLAEVAGTDHRELVYRGPNVMMGYAHGAADLAAGDVQHGTLHTGDLARVDDEGFFTITGRLARFAKLFGRRVNLEDVEREAEAAFALQAAAAESGDGLVLHVAPGARQTVEPVALQRHIAMWLAVPPQSVQVNLVAQLPMTASGKKDYQALRS